MQRPGWGLVGNGADNGAAAGAAAVVAVARVAAAAAPCPEGRAAATEGAKPEATRARAVARAARAVAKAEVVVAPRLEGKEASRAVAVRKLPTGQAAAAGAGHDRLRCNRAHQARSRIGKGEAGVAEAGASSLQLAQAAVAAAVSRRRAAQAAAAAAARTLLRRSPARLVRVRVSMM